MNSVSVYKLFSLFIICCFTLTSQARSESKWTNWKEKLQDRYQEKLSTPSISHFFYLKKAKDSVFVDIQGRPRFSKSKCKSCDIKVKWTSQNTVLVQNIRNTQQMTFAVGTSQKVPWENELYFSTYEIDSLGRLRVFVHDLLAPDLAQKRKRHFFPYHPKFIFETRWNWLSSPRPIKMARSDGSTEEMSALAELEFFFGDEKQTLTIYDYGMKRNIFRQQNSVLILFRDLSNGPKTYGAGRFVSLQLEKKIDEIKTGDKLTLDFNFSYNPPCSVSDGFHCPLPQDFMNLDIQAGETYSKLH